MTTRALLGLAGLNAFVLAIGIAAVWALRGWSSWFDLVRLSGFAYMLGVALFGIALTLGLVVGVPFTGVSILVIGGTLAAACFVGGRLLGWKAVARAAPAAEGRPRGLVLVGAAFGLMLVVYLEALFRSARLTGLAAWDGWSFWVPKGKAIYFFGGLDEQFFSELPNQTYPPLLPALEASAFHFMGSADVVSLHVQFWFFACGFAAAVAGLLAPRVHPLFLWPFLLLALVAPRVVGRNLDPQADFLLDYLFALAALLLALWLVERQPWQLAAALPFLGAAMLTKRDGLLLAACVLGAAFVASWRDLRYAWPRLALVGAGALGVALPWRLWFSSHDLTGELPQDGLFGVFDEFDRAWPALESVVSAAFDFDLWLVVLPLAVAAITLAFIAGARTLPTFALVLYGSALAGFTWVLWSFTELELPLVQDESVNPIVRLTGSLVMLSAALVPLLFDAAWRGGDPTPEGA